MRISVDISEEILEEVMELTGEKNKGPALARAIDEFVRRRKAREFGQLIRESAFDYPAGEGEDARANPVPPLEQ